MKSTELQNVPYLPRGLGTAVCNARSILFLRAGQNVLPALVRIMDLAVAAVLMISLLVLVTKPGWIITSLLNRCLSFLDLIIAWLNDESSPVGSAALPHPPQANHTIIEAVASPRGYDATHLSCAALAGALLNQILARGGV